MYKKSKNCGYSWSFFGFMTACWFFPAFCNTNRPEKTSIFNFEKYRPEILDNLFNDFTVRFFREKTSRENNIYVSYARKSCTAWSIWKFPSDHNSWEELWRSALSLTKVNFTISFCSGTCSWLLAIACEIFFVKNVYR